VEGHLVAGERFIPWFPMESLPPETAQHFEPTDAAAWIPRCPGFLAIAGRLCIVVPRAFCATRRESRTHLAMLTARTLATYAQRAAQRAVTEEDLGLTSASTRAAPGVLARIENSLDLIREEEENGRLTRATLQTSKRSEGRIVWNPTLNRTTAVPTIHAPIYTDPYYRRSRIDPRDVLTRLHAQAVAEAKAELGVGPAEPPSMTNEDALKALDELEHRVFADRPRYLLPLLRRHFEAGATLRDGASNILAHGLIARRFEYVWEDILSVVLRPTIELDPMRGRYWSGQDSGIAGATLLPDLSIVEDEYLLVLDAKHYRPEKPPATESIVKQMVYRHLASIRGERWPLDRIVNAFLIPEALPTGQTVVLRYVHDLIGDEEDAFGYGRVAVLGIDLEAAMRTYNRGQPDPRLRGGVVEVAIKGMMFGRDVIGEYR